MSKIALCLTEPYVEKNLADIRRYGTVIDLAELRVDCLDLDLITRVGINLIKGLVEESDVPIILTIRRESDGGFWDQPEKNRLELIEQLLDFNFTYVDLEDDLSSGPEHRQAERIAEKARQKKIRIIRSFHDFSGIPGNIVSRVKENSKLGDLPKAAVTLSHSRDIVPFMKAAQELESCEKILLAMGERGFFSRILTEKIGSYLTFTSPAGGLKGASGQIDPFTLKQHYRGGQHGKDDPLYGIIGNPVIQSRSPELHNTWLEKKELPGIYVPFLLDNMDDFVSIDRWMNFKGLSVTIPFKEKILPFLDKSSEAVKVIGACNTYFKRGDEAFGENSDAPGFLYPLLDALKLNRKIKNPLDGYKCTLIGAGGASRGVLYALVSGGARVLILNRTLDKAEKLAREFGARSALLSRESIPLIEEYNQIIVQTTSVGMAPMEEEDPLCFYDFKGHEFVYDIIYKPSETLIMKRAKESGCSVLGGWEMLKEQGRVQFELFTESPVPED